jgi:vacuolar-type H+-ATPase catalytic subunit A/Vma1
VDGTQGKNYEIALVMRQSMDEIVKLVGMDAFICSGSFEILEAARSIREDFLHQEHSS